MTSNELLTSMESPIGISKEEMLLFFENKENFYENMDRLIESLKDAAVKFIDSKQGVPAHMFLVGLDPDAEGDIRSLDVIAAEVPSEVAEMDAAIAAKLISFAASMVIGTLEKIEQGVYTSNERTIPPTTRIVGIAFLAEVKGRQESLDIGDKVIKDEEVNGVYVIIDLGFYHRMVLVNFKDKTSKELGDTVLDKGLLDGEIQNSPDEFAELEGPISHMFSEVQETLVKIQQLADKVIEDDEDIFK